MYLGKLPRKRPGKYLEADSNIIPRSSVNVEHHVWRARRVGPRLPRTDADGLISFSGAFVLSATTLHPLPLSLFYTTMLESFEISRMEAIGYVVMALLIIGTFFIPHLRR